MRDRIVQTYQEVPDSAVTPFGEPLEPSDFEANRLEEYEYRGSVQESKEILGRIRKAVDAAAREHGDFPEVVVLGRQDYLAVDALVRHDRHEGKSADEIIDPEIVTVPGRMIHVPEPNETALITALKEKPDA
jgi:hypothetical protein